VIEIVRHPCRQELAQRHDAELRVTTRTVEVRIGQAQRRQLAEIGLAQRREFLEQTGQRSSFRHRELREAIERVEGPPLAVLQDDPDARHPVGSLTMDQVSDDIERTPGFAPFMRDDPPVRKAAQQRVECRGRPRQDGDRFVHRERTPRAIRLCCHSGFGQYISVTRRDHFDRKRFSNLGGTEGQPFSAVPRMLLEPRTPWPRSVDGPPQQPPALDAAAAAITFIGHATFLIQTHAGNLLTDPMYSERAGPLSLLGPRRVRRPAVLFDDLPPISTVLLSHNHYDHCDLPTLRMLAKRFDPIVVTPLGNGRLVRSAGIRRVEELDWWQESASTELPIVLTPAQHFSARTPLDRNRALWGGFALSANHVRIFFAGDTAYAGFFHDIRRRFAPIDLALLPIGAYEPRWFMQAVHMNPAEAVQAHLDLGASTSVGMHFGTFQLTTEGIDEPLRALDEARRARNVTPLQFRTLGFGESMRLEQSL